MSDADNQVGGSGEPFSKKDQGHGDKHEPDTEEQTEDEPSAPGPTTGPRP